MVASCSVDVRLRHATHAPLWVPCLYSPTEHAWHPTAEIFVPSKPGKQAQKLKLTLATGDVALSGHDVQFALPRWSLYSPAAHATHAPPSAPV